MPRNLYPIVKCYGMPLVFSFLLLLFLTDQSARAQQKRPADSLYKDLGKHPHPVSARAGSGEKFSTKVEYPKTRLTDKDAGDDGGHALSDYIKHEHDMLADPATGAVKPGMRLKETQFAHKLNRQAGRLPVMEILGGRSSAGSAVQGWAERGPANVGGRTRALAIDLTNENVILAGGVSGGLWRSEDAGKSWKEVSQSTAIPSITFLVQDPRIGHRNIWYYGTGELIGSSESGGASLLQGNGIFKSTDGGRSFSPLPATTYDNPTIATPFSFIFSLAVNPVNGDLLVGSAKGVFRSQDGGASFTQQLDAASDGLLHIAEVMFTHSGVLYATISHGGHPNRGVYQSMDGGTSFKNITPPTFPASWGRIVMGYAPSNEKIVYFYGYNPAIDSAFIFKYTLYPKGTDSWKDYSMNLPKLGGYVGNLDVQTGYDMYVKIFPTDTNLVFIGGTNIYRSSTGFSKPIAYSDWIGGYSPVNDVSKYSNHHPDQHVFAFYPSDPKKVLTGDDGGVQRTENILLNNGTSEPVTWTSLNNGYYTTQPYSVSLDPFSKSKILMAGFQDNGTWTSGPTAAPTPWTNTAPGDGGFSGLYDEGKTRYASFNYGNIYKQSYPSGTTDGGQPSTVTYISPTTTGPASGFAQIPFFTFDERNKEIMYLPQAGILWRNLHLNKIPEGNPNATSIYWTLLKGTQLQDPATYITAVVTSRTAPANRLYFGSSSGGIYKIDNANIGDKPAEDLSTGKNLPAGYVSSIVVDPSNADRVFVAFSNYGIKSVFYSADAGNTWQSISGNLEQFPDGSGDGPSVRWISVIGNSDRYLAGTSTGLYSATSLAGEATHWTQESKNVLGDDIVPYIKTRDDGYTALAAHGNGLFDAMLPVTKIPSPKLVLLRTLYDISEIAGGPNSVFDLNTIFKSTGSSPYKVSFYNSDTTLVSISQDGHYAVITYKKGKTGTCTLGIIASLGKESVSTGFDVSVSNLADAGLVYSQFNNPGINFAYSQHFTDTKATWLSADDFFIPKGQTWSLERVLAVGAESNLGASYKSINVVVFADSSGKPGKAIRIEKGLAPLEDTTSTNLYVKLASKLVLGAGHYWLSVVPDLNIYSPGFASAQLWGWSAQPHTTGGLFQFERAIDPNAGSSRWSNSRSALLNPDTTSAYDLSFFLYGSALHVAAPPAPENLAATIVNDAEIDLHWDDRSSNISGFKIERSVDSLHFQPLAMTDAGSGFYQDLSLFDRKHDYFYRIAALGIDSSSTYSNIAKVEFRKFSKQDSTTKTAKSALSAIRVFANPNAGLFKVKVPNEAGDVSMTLYTLPGIKIRTVGIVKAGATIALDITGFDNATYILKVDRNKESQSFYVVKE